MKRKNLKSQLLIIFLLVSPIQVFANLELDIEIERKSWAVNKNKEKKAQTKESRINVVLGDRFFSVQEDGKKVVYDFIEKRIFTIDVNKNSFYSDSLYRVIGFNTYEFRNRLYQRQFLAKIMQKPPSEILFIEHELSILGKDSTEEINKSEGGNSIYYKWKDKDLFNFSKESFKVDSRYVQMFSMFIRYYFGGHPSILNELKGMSEIPSEINGFNHGMFLKSYSLSLINYKTLSANPFSIEGLTSVGFEEKDNRLFKLFNRLRNLSNSDMRKNLIDLSNYFDEQIKKKNYLEAFLSISEYQSQYGQLIPSSMSRALKEGLEDESLKNLLVAIGNPKNKEEAIKRVSDLKGFQKLTDKRKAMLFVFEANHQGSLGKHQEAINLFLKALNQNPFLAGAWKDLGDLFFKSYMPLESWRCWDVARKISPNHDLLKPIEAFEKNLASTHPEYFVP